MNDRQTKRLPIPRGGEANKIVLLVYPAHLGHAINGCGAII